jgi:hypothetical protein
MSHFQNSQAARLQQVPVTDSSRVVSKFDGDMIDLPPPFRCAFDGMGFIRRAIQVTPIRGAGGGKDIYGTSNDDDKHKQWDI